MKLQEERRNYLFLKLNTRSLYYFELLYSQIDKF